MLIGSVNMFSQNVGIGTNSPINKLHVQTTGSPDGILLDNISNNWFRIGINTVNGSYNGLTLAGDRVITWGDAAANNANTSLVIGPWDSGLKGLRINGLTGNISIGTSTANNKLEIASGIANTSGLRFTNLTSTSATVSANGKSLSVDANGDVVLVPSSADAWSILGNAGTTAATNFLGTTDAQDLVIKTNSIEKMRVLSNGRVGIGTSIPQEQLHVNGDIMASSLITFQDNTRFTVTNTDIVGLAGASFSMPNYGLATPSWGAAAQTWLSGFSGIHFFTNGVPKPKMSIVAGTGNVGIGTVNPSGKFEVQDNVNGALVSLLYNTNAGASAVARNILSIGLPNTDFMTQVVSNSGSPFVQHVVGAGVTGGTYYSSPFHIFSRLDATEQMRIVGSTGNVGINTSNPAEKLEVAGKIFLNNGFSANNGAIVYQDNTDYLYLGPKSGTSLNGAGINLYGTLNNQSTLPNPGGIDLNVSGSATTAIRILNSGNVGVNTTTPTEKLEIQGSVKIVDGTQGDYKLLTSDASGKADWRLPPSSVTAADGSLIITSSNSGTNTAQSFFTDYVTLPKGVYMVSFYNCLSAASNDYYIQATVESSAGSISTAGMSFYIADFSQMKGYSNAPFVFKVISPSATVRYKVEHAVAGQTITDPYLYGSTATCTTFMYTRIAD